MKKLCFLLLLMSAMFHLSAKDEKVDLSFLKQEPNIKIDVAYENAKLDGVTFEQLDSIVKANSDTIYAGFIKEMNKKSSVGLKYGFFQDARYWLQVHVTSVDEDGSLKAKVFVIDMQTVSQVTSFSIRARGGVIGTFSELLMEAIPRLGENIADYINEHVK